MKKTLYSCSILLLCGVFLQVCASSGSHGLPFGSPSGKMPVNPPKPPSESGRLSKADTKKWLEEYFKEITKVGSDTPRVYTTEKMKEWCDRCTPENAFQSLQLDTKVDPDKNTALHLFCQQADIELLRHIFTKIFPKDYKKGTRIELDDAVDPDSRLNRKRLTPFEVVPVCNWKMYDFLKEYGYVMDARWIERLGETINDGKVIPNGQLGIRIFDKRKAEE